MPSFPGTYYHSQFKHDNSHCVAMSILNVIHNDSPNTKAQLMHLDIFMIERYIGTTYHFSSRNVIPWLLACQTTYKYKILKILNRLIGLSVEVLSVSHVSPDTSININSPGNNGARNYYIFLYPNMKCRALVSPNLLSIISNTCIIP